MPAQGGGLVAVPLGRLHLVTDCRPGRDPVAVVRAALSVGVPVVQVRVPDGWTDRAAYELAPTIEGLCRPAGAPPPGHDRRQRAPPLRPHRGPAGPRARPGP